MQGMRAETDSDEDDGELTSKSNLEGQEGDADSDLPVAMMGDALDVATKVYLAMAEIAEGEDAIWILTMDSLIDSDPERLASRRSQFSRCFVINHYSLIYISI